MVFNTTPARSSSAMKYKRGGVKGESDTEEGDRGNALRRKVLRGKTYISFTKNIRTGDSLGPHGPQFTNLYMYIRINQAAWKKNFVRSSKEIKTCCNTRAFGFNSDDAGDDFHDYASNGSSDFPSFEEQIKQRLKIIKIIWNRGSNLEKRRKSTSTS